MDIAENEIGVGRRFLAEEGLLCKNPTLIVNRDLLFNELAGVRFDYIWAHSVFTHMPLDDISECFEHLHKIIAKDGAFFATYLYSGSSSSRRGLFGGIFYYPISVFQELA